MCHVQGQVLLSFKSDRLSTQNTVREWTAQSAPDKERFSVRDDASDCTVRDSGMSKLQNSCGTVGWKQVALRSSISQLSVATACQQRSVVPAASMLLRPRQRSRWSLAATLVQVSSFQLHVCCHAHSNTARSAARAGTLIHRPASSSQPWPLSHKVPARQHANGTLEGLLS